MDRLDVYGALPNRIINAPDYIYAILTPGLLRSSDRNNEIDFSP